MSYTVFARKYRPQTFAEIIGQDHVVRTLKNAIIQQRLAHAYIFVGPRGTGKTSTARILAKALNCTGGPKADFDPNDPVCQEIASGRSMNVLEFDAASNTQVDKIREIIIDNVQYAPIGGKYKMYIVDEVHMLSTSSFNALLKTLEEPPSHVIFVFATTDVQKVPTTILSRCQRFDLKRIPLGAIRDHLLYIAKNEGFSLSHAAAESIARGAEGGMRDAESMLDQLVSFCGDAIEESDVLRIFGFTSQETVARLAAAVISGDSPAALAFIHEEMQAGRDLTRLLNEIIAHLRALLVAQTDPALLADEFGPERLPAFKEQSSLIDTPRLLDLIESFAAAEQRMRYAPDKKIHLEVATIRAIQTLAQATLGEVLDTLSSIRDGAPAPAPKSPPPPRPAPAIAAAPLKEPVAPAPNRKPPASAPAPVPASPPAEISDLKTLWDQVIQRIRKERPLIAKNVEQTALLEIKAGAAIVGVDPADVLTLDLLDTSQNRRFIEDLLLAIAGQPLTLKFSKREGLIPAPPLPPPAPEPPPDPAANFKNDPIIRQALELFKAEIQAD